METTCLTSFHLLPPSALCKTHVLFVSVMRVDMSDEGKQEDEQVQGDSNSYITCIDSVGVS